MVKLYTAIGTYKLNTSGNPVVAAGSKEYGLVPYELLLWSTLAFRILTFQELRKEFYQREKEMHMLGEMEFEHCLNRLVMRGLIVSGTDETGADALYDLLGHLHVQSVPNNLLVKVTTFIRLVVLKRMSPAKAKGVFQTVPLELMEKQVLSLVKNQTLSTAEIIRCNENGVTALRDNDELMECLYSEDDSDCDKLVLDGRFSDARYKVLAAVANLYLKQRVVFQLV